MITQLGLLPNTWVDYHAQRWEIWWSGSAFALLCCQEDLSLLLGAKGKDAEQKNLAGILVFCFLYVASYHKHNGLKQLHLWVHRAVSQRAVLGMTGFSTQDFTKLEGVHKVLFPLEARSHLLKSCVLAVFCSLWVWDWGPRFLAGCCQLLKAAYLPCHMAPSILKASQSWICLTLPVFFTKKSPILFKSLFD